MKVFCAFAILAVSLSQARADVITILPASGTADAITQRDTWIAANFGLGATADVTTTFESDASHSYTSLDTAIGSFSIQAGGLASTGNGTGNNEFSILDNSSTPFSGRYNTTVGGKNWLDSNDITDVQLTTTADSLFFFITDVNDAGGQLNIQTADGTNASFPGSTQDGNIFFVGITSSDSIGTVHWHNTSTTDGFGLDDFGIVQPGEFRVRSFVSPVPEPASWPAAAAILSLVVVVRLRKATLPR